MDINVIKEQSKNKKNVLHAKTLIMSLSVAVTAILCIVINYYFRFSLLITVPLILIPVYMSSLLNFLKSSNIKDYRFSLKLSLKYCLYGLSRDIWRAFHLVRNLVKSIIVAGIILLIGALVLWMIPVYGSNMNELVHIIFNADIFRLVETINLFLNNNLDIKNALTVVLIVSKSIGALYFIFKTLMATLLVNAKTIGLIPVGKKSYGFASVYQKHRHAYISGLMYFNGFGIGLMVVGYICGATLMILKGQYALVIPTGVAFSLLMMIPVLQNYYIYNEQFLIRVGPAIQIRCAQELTVLLKQIYEKSDLSAEERQLIQKMLEESSKFDTTPLDEDEIKY